MFILFNPADPDAFAVLLNFMRTDKLVIPPNVCRSAVEMEAEFFEVDLKAHINPFQNIQLAIQEEDAKTLLKLKPQEIPREKKD